MGEENETHDGEEEGHHGARHYVKIWGVLLVLLVISIVGPMAENLWITVITAFGIAFVKAGLVAKHFMHINVERPAIQFMLLASLIFMVVLFGGVSPDVMKHEGQHWDHESAQKRVEEATQEASGGHGAHGEGGSHGEGGDHGGSKEGHEGGDEGHHEGGGEAH